jgi:hypothetical protein
MARKKKSRPAGKTEFASAVLQDSSDLRSDAERIRQVRLDGPPLPSARAWLEDAAKRLTLAPGCPERVTDAARALEKEMAEAFRRRWCDDAWAAMSIKNFLTKQNFWPRTRLPKR